jgi:predicted RNase H-like HicB family nuclease
MNNEIEIIVYWSIEDNAFIAEVPELEGCMADGQSYAKAVKNAKIAIAEWIETAKLMGRPVPAKHGKLVIRNKIKKPKEQIIQK